MKTGWQVDRLRTNGFHVVAAEAFNADTGEREIIEADYFFSTMPVKELMRCIDGPVPPSVLEVSDGLILIGRNGMHKYNNQDHSMLTAMTAVDNILEGRVDMSNIWALNTEMEYHESKEGK